jgi:uncharacterized protein (TIGR02996 family)
MNAREGFLQAVLAAPNDDTPRLVFADWLEEQGDEARAEIIRLQCRVAQMPESDPRRTPLKTRAQDLLKEHREEWMRPLRAVLPALATKDVNFARGFPSGVTFRHAEDLVHAANAATVSPLQEVGLSLAGNRIGVRGVRTLAHSAHLHRLTRLDLAGNRLGNGGARIVALAGSLQALTHLDLAGKHIGASGGEALARSQNLRRLTHLNLAGNRIREDGVRAFARSETLQHLTHFNLRGNLIGDAGVRALAESPYLRRLNDLVLDCDLDPRGVTTAVLGPGLPAASSRRTFFSSPPVSRIDGRL